MTHPVNPCNPSLTASFRRGTVATFFFFPTETCVPRLVAGRAALSIVAATGTGLLLQGCGSGFGTAAFTASTRPLSR